MTSRKLTANDLCALTGSTRDQMRGLLAKLPMYARREAQARVASEYTTHDLVLVLICCLLEGRLGLKREAVILLAPSIEQALARPAPVGASEWLVLGLDPPQADRLELLANVGDGIVMSLDRVFEQVDHYLVPGGTVRRAVQSNLALGPVVMGKSFEGKGLLEAERRVRK